VRFRGTPRQEIAGWGSAFAEASLLEKIEMYRVKNIIYFITLPNPYLSLRFMVPLKGEFGITAKQRLIKAYDQPVYEVKINGSDVLVKL
jgi:hypothetical protein